MMKLKMSSDTEDISVKKHRPTILAFHKLLKTLSYGSTNYSPKRFEKLLLSLHRQGRGFDYFENLTIAGNRDIALTFDDGYSHLVEPLLYLIDKYGIKPTIFIPTAYIGSPNRWDYSNFFRNDPHLDKSQIKKLTQSGVRFGSHGHTHTSFTMLLSDNLKKELILSKNILEDLIGEEINSISYPFGRYNRAILDMVEQAGYKYGLTMNFPTENDRLLSLGRYPVYAYDNRFTVQQKINGGRLYRVERAKSNFTGRLSGGTILFNRIKNKLKPR